jgi:hypothetical protein
MHDGEDYINELLSRHWHGGDATSSTNLVELSKVIARDCIQIISDENGDLEKAVIRIVSAYRLG